MSASSQACAHYWSHTIPGIHATVYSLDLDSLTESQAFLAQLPTSDHDHGKPGYVAVKVVNDEVALLPPHDVIKEIRLLKKVSHDNVSFGLYGSFDMMV